MSKYDNKAIAAELNATAMGTAYYGNALRVALDIPELTVEERVLIHAFERGTDNHQDHIALQQLSNKIAKLHPCSRVRDIQDGNNSVLKSQVEVLRASLANAQDTIKKMRREIQVLRANVRGKS